MSQALSPLNPVCYKILVEPFLYLLLICCAYSELISSLFNLSILATPSLILLRAS